MHFIIIFGLRSFCIGRFSARDLGVSLPGYEQYAIERRQRYFHLFWIPVFGCGAYWALHQFGQDPIRVPPHLREQFKGKRHRKKGWLLLANLGLFIAFWIGAAALVVDALEYYHSSKWSKIRFQEKVDELAYELAHPDTGQYLLLSWYETLPAANGLNPRYVYTGYYKVDSITTDSLCLASSDSSLLESISMLKYFSPVDSSCARMWVSRAQLNLAYRTGYHKYLDHYGHHGYVSSSIVDFFNPPPEESGQPKVALNSMDYLFMLEEISRKE